MTSDEKPKRRRGRPARIDRQDIINAMLEGNGSLTLSSVAQKLGTTPQALYHHVQSHSELIELTFRELLKGRKRPQPDGRSWVEFAILMGHYIAEVYRALPGLAEFAIGAQPRERDLYERWEALQQVGVAEGLDPLKTFWATRAIAEFVHGWFAREHRRTLGRSDGASDERDIFAAVAVTPGPAMPLTAAGFQLEEQSPETRFDFTLRALVEGLALSARRAGVPDG